MSTLVRAARLSQPIFLVLAGVLVGATLVAPVAARVTGSGAQPAITTYTRSASCGGLSFYPSDNDTAYDNSGTLRFREAQFGSGIFRCDPGLPDGAIVAKVQFTVFDSIVPPWGVHGCALIRSALSLAAATERSFDRLAVVPPTVGAPGTVRLTDSSIHYATINNTKFGYWLECGLDFYGTGDGIGILGADVVYTISANG